MLDTNISSGCLGLTADEQMNVKAVTRLLPRGWHIALETTDSHETYARVIPPWNTNFSAFLIDREAHGVILTDNISDDAHPVISVVFDIHDAIDYVAAVVVSGAESRRTLPSRSNGQPYRVRLRPRRRPRGSTTACQ